jgi:hypothetical protein
MEDTVSDALLQVNNEHRIVNVVNIDPEKIVDENAVYDTYELSDYNKVTGKNEKHSKIKKQNIYYSAARIGEKLYSVRIKIDIPKNKNDPNYYKDHKITEIKIEPSLYQGSSVTGAPLQNEGSITKISLAVLKGDVKPYGKKYEEL